MVLVERCIFEAWRRRRRRSAIEAARRLMVVLIVLATGRSVGVTVERIAADAGAGMFRRLGGSGRDCGAAAAAASRGRDGALLAVTVWCGVGFKL